MDRNYRSDYWVPVFLQNYLCLNGVCQAILKFLPVLLWEIYKMKKNIITVALVFCMVSGLCFTAFAEESLIINEAGNVGIGEASPVHALVVKEDDSNTALHVTNNTASGTLNYGIFNYVDGDGTHSWGNYNYMIGDATYSHGGYNYMVGDATYAYGTCNRVIGSGSQGIGSHNYVDGSAALNFGSYNIANGTGSTNYGVYGQASGGTANFGGCFSGDIAGYFAGDIIVTGHASFGTFSDGTPFYEGDALAEISKISGKNGEIDHSTLPAFAHVTKKVPVFEESELVEIAEKEAFETALVERVKIVETTNGANEVVKSTIKKGTKKESRGYSVENGKIVEVIEEMPIYETELVKTRRIKDDVYLDSKTGRVFQKIGDGHIYKKDGKVYQEIQNGFEVEERRDIGAMISVLTVAVQQLNENNETLTAENEQLKKQNVQLENRLSKIEKMLESIAKR
jgi:hypothetical protein